MFAKLAKKYGSPNPLEPQTNAFGSTGSVPFGSPSSSSNPSPFGTNQSVTSSPFGGTSSSTTPFGSSAAPSQAAATSASPAPFGSPSPFGQVKPSAPGGSPFGSQTSTLAPVSSPFGQTNTSTGGAFGSTPAPSPFVTNSNTATTNKLFGGRSARDILTAFYQQRNPAKVSEVDKLLAKYAGHEEKLLRNLATKYNIDPSTFGLSPVAPAAGTTPGFGSPPASTAPSFGQSSPMGSGGGFGNMSGTPTQGFGSFANQSQSTTGFGSFGGSAPAPSPGGFGSFGNTGGGFGSSSPATPFGAARR